MTDNLERGTILIVDDNPTNLDVLFEYLDEAGFSVLIAEDGESALSRITYTKPDVILLDVMMPGMDGFETCRHLKANEKTKNIPIIFMTALSETADKVRGFTEGAVDYVTKPLQHEEVLARVTTHMMTQHLRHDLQKQNQALTESNADLDAFTRTVAHDLKTPLNIISGYAEMLVDETCPLSQEEHNEYLNHVVQTIYQMRNITDELLLLSNIRKTDIALSVLPMVHIVQQSYNRLIPVIEQFQAEVIMPEIWPKALGHAPWIEQVWVNYLSNAIKYGGRPPRVELGATTQADGYIRFWIRDNGEGMTKEEQDILFTEFTRLKQVKKVEGHGLGLSIVRRIVEKLGGKVGVESQKGEGSMFYFILRQA